MCIRISSRYILIIHSWNRIKILHIFNIILGIISGADNTESAAGCTNYREFTIPWYYSAVKIKKEISDYI